MKAHFLLLALSLLIAHDVLAHGKEKHDPAELKAGRDTRSAQLDVDPGATEAVAAVERFSAALGTGQLELAAAELDPAVLILESGGAEHSRDEYLGGHARHDAEFLRAARVTLKRRVAHASDGLAWVASESEIHAKKAEAMLMIASTETMVLRKTSQGWKIVHIHWSSRKAAGG